MAETNATTVRLTKADKRNAATVIRSGAATTVTGAIRLALYEAAERRAQRKEPAA